MNTDQTDSKPTASFVLIAYRQEKFVRAAVEGALAQTYSPLEIVLSDDCSPDGTFEIMKELAAAYKGPHRIILNRNEINLGIAGNFNRAVSLASGKYIVIAAGDDISLPERTEQSVRMLEENPGFACVSYERRFIDADGNEFKPRHYNAHKPQMAVYTLKDYVRDFRFHLDGPARTFRRSVFDKFGTLRDDCPTEDSTMLLRCIMTGSACHCGTPLILYRMHGDNLSSSAGMRRMPNTRIFRQFLHDIAVARREKLVADKDLALIRNKVRNDVTRRILSSKMAGAGSPTGFWIRTILPSGLFSPREKLSLLRSAFRS